MPRFRAIDRLLCHTATFNPRQVTVGGTASETSE